MSEETEAHSRRLAFAGVALVLITARLLGPGPLRTALAVGLIVAVPTIALLHPVVGRLFVLVSALGAWVAFPAWQAGEPAALPVMLLNRLAFFAVPPLLVDLTLSEKARARLRIGPLHLYAPAAVMVVGALVHLRLRSGASFALVESEIQRANIFYGLCYLVLLLVGSVLRIGGPQPRVLPAAADRGTELDEEGRFALASRVHERDGQFERAAQAAERAGDWARAARLYKQTGQDVPAGDMFYRAEMWSAALEAYEQGHAFAAAARLATQLGDLDRALKLYEEAGDRPAAVRALESAGRPVSAEQYRRAGMLDRAADAFEQAGEWERAADVFEHDLHDVERAAATHLKAGSGVHAGRLLESVGRSDDALRAYLSVPAGSVDAARLLLASGKSERAAEVLARLPQQALEKLEDERTLVVVARVMLESNRVDEAIAILQQLKRRGGETGGSVHLLLGRAFQAKGLRDLAVEELRIAQSLPLEPSDELLATYLSGCLQESLGRYEDALEDYRRVLKQDLKYRDVEKRYRRTCAIISQGALGARKREQRTKSPVESGGLAPPTAGLAPGPSPAVADAALENTPPRPPEDKDPPGWIS